ncbi:MAG: hypothetical protein KA717_22590 [Woronichinia naegeliana WA131]|jgi:hypothetical protein|uniref:Uncharacterized protein n=1 Tax=Woronichinia naegeliana WA131 TaxID=2824559 RepID=A0A977KSA9_9CYAN|nr:MAG: hypothetical protein KA717_22590 [Woronichinia naegeliana WA131]
MLQAQAVPSFIDRPVGNPKFSYYDNEYSPTTNQMIYRNAATGTSLLSNVYIVDFEPNTGIIPTNTKGRLIGVQQQSNSVTPGQGVPGYGASFGLSAKGLAVYYTGVDTNGQYQLFRWYTTDANPIAITTGSYPKVGGALPSVNAQDTSTSMIYLQKQTTNGTDLGYLNVWKEGTPTNTGAFLPYAPKNGGSEGPRWIENSDGTTTRSIITTVRDTNGVNQAARFDVDSRTTTTLTTDSGNQKTDPKILATPEYNGENIIVALLNHSKIGVYRQINNQWTLINTTTVPYPSGQIPWLANPLPFVFGGRSYVALVAGVVKGQQTTQTNDVWVLSLLDNSVQLKVSNYGTTPQLVFDPEVTVSTTNNVLVSYQTSSQTALNSLRVSQVFLPTSPTMGKVAHHPAMLPSLAMMPFLGVALVALFFRSRKKGRSPLCQTGCDL